MAKALFGTDGIRGIPGTPPLDDQTLYATGRGLAEFKRASNELRGQLENEMRQLEAEERQKKIWPPPANTVTALPETGSAPGGTVVPAASAAAVASSDSHPTSASGVEGA